MKTFLTLSLVLVVTITAVIVYERFFVQGQFGPSSMLAVLLLLILILLLLVTLFTYETRFKQTMAKLWIVGISVFFTYFLVDLVSGYFLITPLSPELVSDEYRHHKLAPGCHAKFEQRDFSYIQRVNSSGLRGRDIQNKKPFEIYRIIMLGDSFTMGKGVEDHQTFSFILEKSLNQRLAVCNARKIEVLNAGVDSYAPVLSFIQLKRDLEPLEPDMVVLNLDVSDLVQETVYRKQAVYASNGEIIGVPGPEDKMLLNERIRAWIEQNLYFTRLLLFFANKLLDHKDLTVRTTVEQANYEVTKHTLTQDEDQDNKQWQNIFDNIHRIKKYCDRKGINFLLSIYPWGHQVNDKEWTPGRYNFIPEGATVSDSSVRKIQKFTLDNHIRLVNVFPLFRSYNGKPALYFRYDMHWTPAGHELMAKGLADYLLEQYRLKWCNPNLKADAR